MAMILIVEDEKDLNSLIRRQVLQAYNGPTAVEYATQEHPELIILDWMLPGLDGLEVCRRVRQVSIAPILMLTARSEEIDRVLGLEVGADDYLTKPFSIRELLARVHALLRRMELDQAASQPGEGPLPVLTTGPLQVDPSAHVVRVDGQPVELASKTFALLEILVRHLGRAFSRDYLVEKVWGYDANGSDRTVDTHVLRLRKKLGPVGERIKTVWGTRLSLRR